MTKASFRQADIERIMRAAARTGMAVEIDLKTMIIRVVPNRQVEAESTTQRHAPDGKENWEPKDFETLAQWQAWRDLERAHEKLAAVEEKRADRR